MWEFLQSPRGHAFIERVSNNLSFTTRWLPSLDLNFAWVLMAAVSFAFVVPHFTSNFYVIGSFWPAAFYLAVWLVLQSWVFRIAYKAVVQPFADVRTGSPGLNLVLAVFEFIAACTLLFPVQLMIVAHFKPDLVFTTGVGAIVAWIVFIVGEFLLDLAVRINVAQGE
jgi:hypothetical protein